MPSEIPQIPLGETRFSLSICYNGLVDNCGGFALPDSYVFKLCMRHNTILWISKTRRELSV